MATVFIRYVRPPVGYPERHARVPRAQLHFPGTHSVWFRISVAAARTVRLDACNGSRPDIGVFTGGRVNRLTRVPTGSFCLVQFAARPGVIYRLALETSGGEYSGGFRLTARTARPPANDNFADAIPITLGTTTSGTTRDASL